MSDSSQGPGWWQASDGKWYPPEQAPGAQSGGAGQSNLAEWGPRALGILIDYASIVVIIIVGSIIATIFGAVSDILGMLVWLVVYIFSFVAWLYYGYLVGARGYSPGMAIMGLRCVSSETGQTIGGGMGVVRSIAHIVDSIICYIGWLFPLWDAERQTLADKIVKTHVLKNQPTQKFSAELWKP